MSDNAVILKSNGVYKIGEAARLVSWADGGHGAESLSRKELREWVDSGVGLLRWADVPGGKRRLTFRALISLRLIFRAHRLGVPLDVITGDADRRQRMLEVDWPFARKGLWEFADEPVLSGAHASSRLEASLRGVQWLNYHRRGIDSHYGLEFDRDEVACAWRPAKDVKIEPGIVSGAPCIDGTRIPTGVIWGMAEAGESVAEIADWYGLPDARVSNAVDWEKQLADINV